MFTPCFLTIGFLGKLPFKGFYSRACTHLVDSPPFRLVLVSALAEWALILFVQ
jgi:hypothetical protein